MMQGCREGIKAYIAFLPTFPFLPCAGVAPLSVQASGPNALIDVQPSATRSLITFPFHLLPPAFAGVATLSVQASGPNALIGAQPSAIRWLITFPFWASGNVPLLAATANADLVPASSLVSAGVVTDASANITGQLAIR